MTSQELLELVDKNSIIDIMESLGALCTGSGTTSDGVTFLKFPTICHNGSSKDKLYWYENSKNFQCWTCCGTMSLYTLVMKVRGCDFKESIRYVAGILGISLSSSNRKGIQDPSSVKEVNEEINRMSKAIEQNNNKICLQSIKKSYNDNVLKRFDKTAFYQGWIDEGISIETMQKYEIGFDWEEGHIIIPHRNQNGDLVGIRRRSLNPEDAKNKYMPKYIDGESYEHPLALNLYGIYQNHDSISKRKTAIIVEGEKSVMLSDTYYGDKSIALATCGFNVSDWQIKALKNLGVRTVYLGFDKDFDITKENEYKQDNIIWDNYSHYKNRLDTLGKRLSIFFNTYIMYDRKNLLKIKDSPMDEGKEKLEALLINARLVK